jgi:hypothetical protein
MSLSSSPVGYSLYRLRCPGFTKKFILEKGVPFNLPYLPCQVSDAAMCWLFHLQFDFRAVFVLLATKPFSVSSCHSVEL